MKTMSLYRLHELLAPHAAPCISIYQPTHRKHPENHQDPIRFKNLVAQAEVSLREKYPTREVRSLIAPFDALAANAAFWNHTHDGLAVFGTSDSFRVYGLQRTVPELAVVADSLHIKPLLRFVQSADRYHVLCIGRDAAKLYEGNRDALDIVDLASEIPRSNADIKGDDGSAVHPGHGPEKDDKDAYTERFFRAVDRGVIEYHSHPSGLPLILVAATENHEIFRKVSHNPSLLPEGVRLDPWALSPERLREEAWKVVLPHYLHRLAGLVESFGNARAKEHASGDLSDIARAAIAGRVATLLVEADRVVPGALDLSTGTIHFAELAHPEVDDLIDDLAELVLRMGGEVVVAPSDRMPIPGGSGAAAIYRF